MSKYASDESFFAFHEINSFEGEDGSLFLDLPAMKDHSFLEAAKVPNLRANVGRKTDGPTPNDPQGTFTRYRLPSHTGGETRFANGTLITFPAEQVMKLPYSKYNIELPRINQQYSGKPYRYAYGIHVEQSGFFADSLIKIDTHTQQSKTWSPATKQLPSEPIFVAAPGAVDEDDGVLLSVAMDASVRKSSLVVVNATTMAETGRARMPIVMGYGFHGVWGAMQ